MNTREHILEAAENVIRSRGFARATTKEIARVAGCSEGSLYNHFKGKEDLFMCILHERLPAFIQQVVRFPGRAGHGTVRGNLRELAGTALDFYRHAIPLGSSMLSEPDLLARHRDVLSARSAGPQKGNELLATYFRAEQKSGRVRADADPDAAAYAILGACFQRAYSMTFWGEEPSRDTLKAFVDQVLDVVLPGLLPTSGPSRE